MNYSFLLVLWTLLHCLPARALPPTPINVSGRLAHAPAGDSVQLSYHSDNEFRLLEVPLSATGEFSLTILDLPAPALASFSYKEKSTTLYLTPGDKLALQVDYPLFEQTLKYTGKGAHPNNYLARSRYTYGLGFKGPVVRPQDQVTATTTPEQMRQTADAFRQKQLSFLTTYAATHPLPPAFQRDATEHIDLQWVLALLEYPTRYQKLTTQAAVLPATYYDFLTQLPPHTLDPPTLRDRGADDNTLVAFCLQAYADRLVPSGVLSTDPSEGERIYTVAMRELQSVEARDLMMSMLFYGQVQDNLPGVEAAYPAFQKYNHDASRNKELQEAIARQRQVQAGQIVAPAFTLTDDTGKTVTLADFKGKVVYLDFWGTWCAPCMAEMPASNTLRQQFLGREVVFLYVAVGDKEDRWQQVLTAKQLRGPNSVHLRALDDSISTAYRVNGFPAYLLIGRDGRIRSAKAPRPSEGDKAVAALEEALGQQ